MSRSEMLGILEWRQKQQKMLGWTKRGFRKKDLDFVI